MKEQYIKPETEILEFRIHDVIATSQQDEHETPIISDQP